MSHPNRKSVEDPNEPKDPNDAKDPNDSKNPRNLPESSSGTNESINLNIESNNLKLGRSAILPQEPPDGGIRAFAVLISSFIVNGILFGVINSYGIIHCHLAMRLKHQNVTNYESKSALVGSLSLGFIFLLSPLAGALTAILGPRLTTVLGGGIAAASLLLSSFVANHANALWITYGFMYGLGASLAYTPSLAILGNYFKRYLGLANGFASIGGCVFTVIIPPIMEYTVKTYGLEALFRMLAVLTVGVIFCGLSFQPLPAIVPDKTSIEKKNFKSILKTAFNVEIWKIKKYRYWALFMPITLFGYFVPYVQLKKFVRLQFPDKNDNAAIMCIGGSSAAGSLLFGFLADRKSFSAILLQQISFYSIGSFTIILPHLREFCLVILVILGMGIFDGGMTSLVGPIAIEFCGTVYAAQAIGCMLGLVAAPLTLGPPVAAYVYSLTRTYTLPFLFAGSMPIIGASLMWIITCQKQQ